MIRLRDDDLFGNLLGELGAVFLRRVFGLDEVKWVEIDPHRSAADICYNAGRSGLTDVLHCLAAAIRGRLPSGTALFPHDSISPALFDPSAGSRSSDLASSSRLGTSLMIDPGGSGSAMRRFVTTRRWQVGSQTSSITSLGSPPGPPQGCAWLCADSESFLRRGGLYLGLHFDRFGRGGRSRQLWRLIADGGLNPKP